MEAEAWKSILRNYEDNSGQQINYSKSKLYFFNTDAFMQRKIRNILGYQSANLLDTYLGLFVNH